MVCAGTAAAASARIGLTPQSGDGRNLVERMVCLSPPLWIATYVTYYAAATAYSWFGPQPLPPPQNPEDLDA
jgi:hypothetical protein